MAAKGRPDATASAQSLDARALADFDPQKAHSRFLGGYALLFYERVVPDAYPGLATGDSEVVPDSCQVKIPSKPGKPLTFQPSKWK